MDRPKTLGGSDATRIMKGDWLSLYNEKKGIAEPENLDDVFRVQLGICTEKLHVRWFSTHEAPLSTLRSYCFWQDGNRHVNLDAWCPDQERAFECKHTNEHNDLRSAAKFYMGQLTHTMFLTDTEDMWFSIIRGNNTPEWGLVEWNETYAAEYQTAMTAFQWHLDNDVPPEADGSLDVVHAAETAKADTVIGGLVDVDMTGNNQWADFANQYIATKQIAKQHEEYKKGLKTLVTKDMASAVGHGIQIKRSKSGSLLFKEV